MNEDRRTRLNAAISDINKAQEILKNINRDEVTALINGAKEVVDEVRDEEQETLENMPENMQGGERGQAMEEAVSTLEEASSELEELTDNAEIIEQLIHDLEDVATKITGLV